MIERTLNNRYKLLSLLGEGGMALVYEAEDLLLGRKVAVKVLREQFASDPGFLTRFQHEAKAAAGLSHPNIVGIYDVGSEGPIQYIVMELVRGKTLKEIVLHEGALSGARVIDLGRQICEGLEYAHEHGLVHRDVKSHNILLGRDGRAKIADFGIAIALGGSSLTQSGFIVGSAQYLSPEQARGEPTTPLSDLYAAGIVLYEMATGQLPFEGETPVAVALKQVQAAPVPPRKWNPSIPESLQSVILRAMAKEPSDRYESARALAGALRASAATAMETTVAQPIPVPPARAARGRATAPAARDVPVVARQKRSSSMTPLLLLLIVFLLAVGSVPLAIMAYTNGSLGRLFPSLLTSSPTAGPAPQQTPAPTAGPTAAPGLKSPQLVGKPFPQALQMAQADGLDLVITGQTFSSQYPLNSVIDQQPPAGTPVEKGSKIQVTISQGAETAAVPGVVGETAPNAEGRLQAAGFRWKLVEQPSDQIAAGVVMAQDPGANARADKGSEVTLTVSSGRAKVAVPNVIGKPEAEAQDAIVQAGLTKTWVNYQDYTTVPPGAVISQDPKPGTMVEKGTTVYIAVRNPQPPTPTPAPTAVPTPPKKQ
ncbi:MAG TPA: Stk1 family PASTA domain-containing Ser/Thr kinase [Chloroflexota bacterium]